MSKCFAARFGQTTCHIEVGAVSASEAMMLVARPWAQDGSRIRPVLTAAGEYPEFVADAEGAALIGAIEFLEGRFGRLANRPVPCRTSDGHRKSLSLPLRWTERLPRAATPRGRAS